MRQFVEFLKTTIAGGFFIALPVVLVILVVDEAVSIVRGLIGPLAEQLPVDHIGGIAVAKVIAVLFILGFCFLMGHRFEEVIRSRFKGRLTRDIHGSWVRYRSSK